MEELLSRFLYTWLIAAVWPSIHGEYIHYLEDAEGFHNRHIRRNYPWRRYDRLISESEHFPCYELQVFLVEVKICKKTDSNSPVCLLWLIKVTFIRPLSTVIAYDHSLLRFVNFFSFNPAVIVRSQLFFNWHGTSNQIDYFAGSSRFRHRPQKGAPFGGHLRSLAGCVCYLSQG